MVKPMLGISLADRKPNIWINNKTGVNYNAENIEIQRWSYDAYT